MNKEATFAGTFYPDSSEELNKLLESYKEEIETDEEGNPTINYDFTDCDVKSAVKEQIYLPNEIGEILRDRDRYPHLYAKVFKKLTKDALDWNVDDFEVILDD